MNENRPLTITANRGTWKMTNRKTTKEVMKNTFANTTMQNFFIFNFEIGTQAFKQQTHKNIGNKYDEF